MVFFFWDLRAVPAQKIIRMALGMFVARVSNCLACFWALTNEHVKQLEQGETEEKKMAML